MGVGHAEAASTGPRCHAFLPCRSARKCFLEFGRPEALGEILSHAFLKQLSIGGYTAQQSNFKAGRVAGLRPMVSQEP